VNPIDGKEPIGIQSTKRALGRIERGHRIPGRRRGGVLLFALVIIATFAVLWSAVPTIVGSGSAPSVNGPNSSTVSDASTGQFPTSIRHVVVVMLENEDRGTVMDKGLFEKHLTQTYSSASNYYAICHPSAPNYLAITSGKPWQCGSDNYTEYTSANLGSLVDAAGLTWKAYDESMSEPCDRYSSGLYAVRHNPFMFYSDVVSNKTFCDSHVVNSKYFNESAASDSLPTLSFYTPNLCDDGHDYCGGSGLPIVCPPVDYVACTAQADTWLKNWMSPLLNDSIFSKSVFFVTYDESANSDAGYNGTAGGKVYFAAVSPDVKSDFSYTADASPYNLLTTIEWLLGLGHTGHNDSWTSWPPMRSIFKGAETGAADSTPGGRTVSFVPWVPRTTGVKQTVSSLGAEMPVLRRG
jgi:phosphatidylinositol-3-phosphatase